MGKIEDEIELPEEEQKVAEPKQRVPDTPQQPAAKPALRLPTYKEDQKMNKLKAVGAILGVLALVLILMMFPEIEEQAQEQIHVQPSNVSVPAYTPSDEEIGKNLLEYSKNYGKSATFQLSDYKEQPDGSFVGSTVTKYSLTLDRIGELDRTETSKTLKLFFTVENLGDSIGTEGRLLFIDQVGRVSVSDCSYLAQPRTEKELGCVFKDVALDAQVKTIAVRRTMGPGRDAVEKLIELKVE